MLLGGLLVIMCWLASCHRTVPFDTALAAAELDAPKKDPARPPTPDSTGSVAASSVKRDTLTTARDTLKGPSIQTAKMKEEADKLAKEKQQSKQELRALARKVGSTTKKLKGKSFLGYRIKKGYARTGSSKNGVIEKFYYLKKYEAPDPYAPAKYYYHRKKHRVFKAATIDPKISLILHGPYEKRQNGVVIESGYFYVGTKHLRWERNAIKDNILLSKTHWEKGFPHDARITYYDEKRTKIQEVIPYDHTGKLEGDYVRFLPNGQLDWTGEFQGGRHVGTWMQYWGFRNRRHYEWQYPESEFVPDAPPVLVKEYNRNGTLIYEKGKLDKREQNAVEERRAGQKRQVKGKAGKQAVADQDPDGADGEATTTTPAAKEPARPGKGARPTDKKAAEKKPAATKAPSTTPPATDSTAAAPASPRPPGTKPTAEEARERMRQQMQRPKAKPRTQPD